jgi:hypothetical protein
VSEVDCALAECGFLFATVVSRSWWKLAEAA